MSKIKKVIYFTDLADTPPIDYYGIGKSRDIEKVQQIDKQYPKALIMGEKDLLLGAVSGQNTNLIAYLLTSPETEKYHKKNYEHLNDALTKAAREGHIDTVKYLCTNPKLPLKPDLSYNDNGALMNASVLEQMNVIYFLLKQPITLTQGFNEWAESHDGANAYHETKKLIEIEQNFKQITERLNNEKARIIKRKI